MKKKKYEKFICRDLAIYGEKLKYKYIWGALEQLK